MNTKIFLQNVATEAAKMVFVVCYRTSDLFSREGWYHSKSFGIKLKSLKIKKLEVNEDLPFEDLFLQNPVAELYFSKPEL